MNLLRNHRRLYAETLLGIRGTSIHIRGIFCRRAAAEHSKKITQWFTWGLRSSCGLWVGYETSRGRFHGLDSLRILKDHSEDSQRQFRWLDNFAFLPRLFSLITIQNRKGGKFGVKFSPVQKPYCLHTMQVHSLSFNWSITVSLLIKLLSYKKQAIILLVSFNNIHCVIPWYVQEMLSNPPGW